MDSAGWHQVKINRGIVTVMLHGDFDVDEANELRRTLCPLATNPNMIVHVDLSDVSFLGSAALGAVLSARAAARDSGASFTVIEPSPCCLRLIDIAGVGAVLGLNSDTFVGSAT